jgi:hypothetical protein
MVPGGDRFSLLVAWLNIVLFVRTGFFELNHFFLTEVECAAPLSLRVVFPSVLLLEIIIFFRLPSRFSALV